MWANTQQFGTRYDNPPVNEVNLSSIYNHFHQLLSLVERYVEEEYQQVTACGIFNSMTHPTDLCPMIQEETIEHANVVGLFGPQQRGYDPHLNMYNPGRTDYPSLSYVSQSQNWPPPPPPNSTPGPSLEDMVKALVTNTQQFQQQTQTSIQQFQQQTQMSIQNLESQISQLASSISKLESQGEPDQKMESSEKQTNKPKTTVSEHHKALMVKPPLAEGVTEKKEGETKGTLEIVSKVVVNIPLIDAMKRVPHYAKFLKVSGSRTYKNKAFHDKISSRKNSLMNIIVFLGPHHLWVHYDEKGVDVNCPNYSS
ncbi:UNVERIFIED_CONTAM: hypothetical protein Sindi_1679800 [Sesamum indicum]